jgi:UDPglucose 6-dehydrogenase
VEYKEVETTVYSMETTTGTLIASSGLICHNCFPKDVKALAHMANVQGKHPQLLQTVIDINYDQRKLVADRVRDLLGGSLEDKMIGLLGLAFKPNTDDMREAPSIDIAHQLQIGGAKVKGYDPVSMTVAGRMMPNVQLAEDPYELAKGCDALVIVTEWNEFKQLDMKRIKQVMRGNIIVDGRNIYEPRMMKEHGFVYRGIGRGYNGK